MTKRKRARQRRQYLSQSSAGDFGSCPRKFYYSRILGLSLRPEHQPLYLDEGKLWHELLDRSIYGEVKRLCQDMPKAISIQDAVDEWTKEHIRQLEERQKNQQFDFVSDSVTVEQIEDKARMWIDIANRYRDKYLQKDIENYQLLGTEVKFRFPLRVPCNKCNGETLMDGPYCGKCSGTGLGRKSPKWDAMGIIDRIVRERKTNRVLVIESKTTGDTPVGYMTGAWSRAQSRLYLLGAEHWLKEQGVDSTADGIIYDVVRKKVPSVPKMTQCRTCKSTGEMDKPTLERYAKRMKKKNPAKALFAEGQLQSMGESDSAPCPECEGTGVGGISRAACDTTVDVFRATVEKYPHIKEAEYLETLLKLEQVGDVRFMNREEFFVERKKQYEWMLDAYFKAREIDTMRYWYRNESACDRPFPCAFSRLCIDGGEGAMDYYWTRDEKEEQEREEQERQQAANEDPFL